MTFPSDGDKAGAKDGSSEAAWGPGLSIREMAGKYGVSLRTLRFYEQRGLLSPRRYNFGRVYSGKDEVTVQLILTGRRLGFALHEIKTIMESRTRSPGDEQGKLSALLDATEIERQLRTLEARRRSIDAALIELRRKIGCG